MLIALVAFLIPVFVGVFKQFGGKLPALTQFMVNFSHLVTHQWYILIVVVGAAVGGVHVGEALRVGPRRSGTLSSCASR